METPPQFPGAPKKSKTGLVLGIILGAVLLCCCGCGGFFWYFFKNAKQYTGYVGCAFAMDSARDGLLAYAEDHKGTLPPAKDWQTAIKPYLKPNPKGLQDQNMIDIAGPDDDFCDKNAATGLTYNSDVAGKKVADIKDQMGTIALFETSGRGRNKSAKWAEPPFASSPVIVMGERRGWVRQGLKGEAAIKDKTGNVKPLSSMGNGIKVEMNER